MRKDRYWVALSILADLEGLSAGALFSGNLADLLRRSGERCLSTWSISRTTLEYTIATACCETALPWKSTDRGSMTHRKWLVRLLNLRRGLIATIRDHEMSIGLSDFARAGLRGWTRVREFQVSSW